MKGYLLLAEIEGASFPLGLFASKESACAAAFAIGPDAVQLAALRALDLYPPIRVLAYLVFELDGILPPSRVWSWWADD